jgi:hypothetical protein
MFDMAAVSEIDKIWFYLRQRMCSGFTVCCTTIEGAAGNKIKLIK